VKGEGKSDQNPGKNSEIVHSPQKAFTNSAKSKSYASENLHNANSPEKRECDDKENHNGKRSLY